MHLAPLHPKGPSWSITPQIKRPSRQKQAKIANTSDSMKTAEWDVILRAGAFSSDTQRMESSNKPVISSREAKQQGLNIDFCALCQPRQSWKQKAINNAQKRTRKGQNIFKSVSAGTCFRSAFKLKSVFFCVCVCFVLQSCAGVTHAAFAKWSWTPLSSITHISRAPNTKTSECKLSVLNDSFTSLQGPVYTWN